MPMIDSDKTPVRSTTSRAEPFDPAAVRDLSVSTWPQNLDDAIDQATRLQSTIPTPTIPGFTDIKEIGRGGMGMVYRAEQVGLHRPVAIKMILAGNYADPTDRMRFKLEAELTARVQHPHVVQVYEAGEHEGRPYLVMEWIDGGTLADKLRGQKITPRSAAAAMITLAKAVHAAHCRGVIHRDLKPNNILLATSADSSTSQVAVTGSNPRQPMPEAIDLPLDTWHLKVTDFGLAKPTAGGAHLTGSQFVVGTPAYMAPEQASNQNVGPAADVYALGVLLFEMLTGRTPFVDASPMLVLMKAMNDEPPMLRSIQPALPRDLEAICSKCLRKAPDDRYATAQELADDLENYLQGKLLKARPLSNVQSGLRWARRHKLLTGMAAALVLVTVSALVIITRLYLEAKDQTEQANKERGIAVAANAVAKREADHSSAFKEFLLSDVLQSAQPHRKGIKVTVKDALDDASRNIDEKFLKLNPELAAQLHDELGFTYFKLDQYAIAEKHQRRALELYLQTIGANAKATLQVRHNILSNLVRQARWSEADTEYEDLYVRMSQLLGNDDPETLTLLETYARMQEKRGHLPQAIAAYRKLAVVYDKMTGKQSHYAIVSKANLANVLRTTDQNDEADQLMKVCITQARELLGPEHQLTLGLNANEALHYLKLRRFKEAEPLLQAALAGFEEVYGADSAQSLTILNNLAGCYDGLGKFAEAITLKQRVVAGRSKLFGAEHPNTLVARSNLYCAEMDEALRKKADSTKPFTDLVELLKLRTKVSGPEHHDTLLQAYTLGYFSNRRDDPAAGISYYRQAMEGYRKTLGDKHEMTMQCTMNLGGTLATIKQLDAAENMLRVATDNVAKYKPKDHWLQGKVKSMLGQVLVQRQKFGEAEPLLLEAYDIVSKNREASPDVLDITLKNLVEYYTLRGLTKDADKWSAKLTEHATKTAKLR